MSTRRSRALALTALTTAAALTATLSLTVLSPADARAAKITRAKANWGDLSFQAGAKKLIVQGTASGPRRPVHLQYRSADGWHTWSSRRTNAEKRYRIRADFGWYGKHPVRVHVPATSTHRAWTSKARTVKVTKGYSPHGKATDFAFLKDSDGHRTRFDPCQVVRYRINPNGINRTIIRETKQAMARLTWGSGLRVKYVGKTDYVPFVKKGFPRRTDMVLAWATEAKRPGLVGYGGLGGAISGDHAQDASGRTVYRIDTAGALFNLKYRDGWGRGFVQGADGRTPIGLILMHEIGHAMGLHHTRTAKQIMWGGTWDKHGDGLWRAHWEAGDLTGMRQLGAGQGCLRSMPARTWGTVEPPRLLP